jgi:hypothetical protein
MSMSQPLDWVLKSFYEGWHSLLTDLYNDLERLDDEIIISQVKVKFGGLRFYAYGTKPEVQNLIRRAEERASKTCEVCGVQDSTVAINKRFWNVCAGCEEETHATKDA